MKFALLSLAAVVSAIAPRDPPPLNSNPVQTGGETTPTQSLTILPIVSETDLPTTTSSDKITLPILTSSPTHTTHTIPPSSAPTSLPTNSNGSTYSSSDLTSTSSRTTTHNSTASSGTAPTSSGTSGSGTTGSQTTGSPTSSGTGSSSSSTAAAAVATANVLAGIAAIAGLVMAA